MTIAAIRLNDLWSRWGKLLVFAIWVAAAGWMICHHAFWRDEVRALNFATSGRSVAQMFATVRGDAHPMLWFLMLRAGHALMGSVALPIIAFTVGAVAAAIIWWRAPLPVPMRLLLLFSHFILWDSTVMARNYGISALLMLSFALLYRRSEGRGPWLIAILVLLANTNVHSMLLSWLLLGVVMAPRLSGLRDGIRGVARVAGPVAVLAIASLACLLTIYPSFNDAAVYVDHRDGVSVLKALLLPGYGFLVKAKIGLLAQIPLSIAIYAVLLRFAHDRLLLAAAWAGTAGLSLFFTLIYPASERHIGLWLIFILCLCWIDRDRMAAGTSRMRMRHIGNGGLYLLLAVETAMLGAVVVKQARFDHSQSSNVARLIAADHSLDRAIIIGDPDMLIEALPYYLPNNPVYRLREQAFGPLNHYTRHARLNMTLDEILGAATALHDRYDRPVVILLSDTPRLDKAEIWGYGYDRMIRTRVDPPMARRFFASTMAMAHYPPAMTDESYGVYRLRD